MSRQIEVSEHHEGCALAQDRQLSAVAPHSSLDPFVTGPYMTTDHRIRLVGPSFFSSPPLGVLQHESIMGTPQQALNEGKSSVSSAENFVVGDSGVSRSSDRFDPRW